MPYGQNLYLERKSYGSAMVKKGVPTRSHTVPSPSGGREAVYDSLYDERQRSHTMPYPQPSLTSSRRPSQAISQRMADSHSGESPQRISPLLQQNLILDDDVISSLPYSFAESYLVWERMVNRVASRCGSAHVTHPYRVLLNWLQVEAPDWQCISASISLHGRLLRFAMNGPFANPQRTADMVQKRLKLYEIDLEFTKTLLHQDLTDLGSAQEAFIVAQSLRPKETISAHSYVYEARVTEACKLTILGWISDLENPDKPLRGTSKRATLERYTALYDRVSEASAIIGHARSLFDRDPNNMEMDCLLNGRPPMERKKADMADYNDVTTTQIRMVLRHFGEGSLVKQYHGGN